MNVLTLAAGEVERLLDPDALLDALAGGFHALSAGQVDAPQRIGITSAAGLLLAMPAAQAGHETAIKLVTSYPDNDRLGLPSHQALLLLFDPATGSPLALMDGNVITALRTAGAAALSARLLARPEAATLAIIGAGVQGRAHLRMLGRARPFTEIRIASRQQAHAEDLAAGDPRARAVASAEEAVRGADVICLCTSAAEPVMRAEWLAPGTHLTSVGWAPPGSELDREAIARGRLFVETRMAFTAPPAGCAELAGMDPSSGVELGEVVSGQHPGRQTPDELTVYKAMGHAVEDLAAASLVYRRARQEGAGHIITL